jgi:peptidoglycan/xylan/chitin deacetylase (PgdA/CDA1 family)
MLERNAPGAPGMIQTGPLDGGAPCRQDRFVSFSVRETLRRALFLSVSTGFFLADRLGRLVCSILGKRTPATAVVLYYHSIPKDKRAAFARQMDELVRIGKPLPADFRLALAPGEHFVAVTFDDGYQNNIENAVPELVQRGIPATLFVVTGALGGTPTWQRHAEALDYREPIMSADAIGQLPLDLIRVGSHTRTHRMLTALPEDEARRELSESRRTLSEITRSDVRLFCFPYGAFDERLIAWCREAGYERVFTTMPHLAFTKTDEFVVGRVIAEPADWPLEFRLKLLGAYRWLPFAFSMKRRILQRFHRN